MILYIIIYVYYIIFNNIKIKKLNIKIETYSSSPKRMRVKKKKKYYWKGKENTVDDFNDFSRLF